MNFVNAKTKKRVALREARKAKGFTQAALAKELGVTIEHVKSLEYGRVNPSTPLMFKICKVLEKQPDELFDA